MFAALQLCGIQNVHAAGSDIDSGNYCGVPWKITSDYSLVIGTSGQTTEFNENTYYISDWPWATNREIIKKAYFQGTVIGAESMYGMFYGCSEMKTLDVKGLDTSHVNDMKEMFDGCTSLTALDLSTFNTSNVEDMCNMFQFCESLKTLNLSSFDTQNVTDMNGMFNGCKSLTALDLSTFNTSNVESMDGMFQSCESLKTLNLSSFDTQNVEYMSNMFSDCKSLKALDLTSFNTSNVDNMCSMFQSCESLKSLDLSSFDTQWVEDMYGMFNACKSLETLNVTSFDTHNVKDMGYMFSSCERLNNPDLTSFDTSNVEKMYYMFMDCGDLKELDLSSFETENVTDMDWMFSGCYSLERLDISKFNTLGLFDEENFGNILAGCVSLREICLGENTKLSIYDTWYAWKRFQSLDGEPTDGPVINELCDYDMQYPGWYRTIITTVSFPKSIAYTGGLLKPMGTIQSGDAELCENEDYIITYKNNRNVGTATVTVEGIGKFTETFTRTFKITARTLKASNITAKKQAVFTGKAITPKVTVKVGKNVLKKGFDYTVSYSNNKKVGTAKITIKGKGNCKGTVSKTFRILPPKLKATAKAKKGKVIVTLKSKPKCAVTYYEIRVGKNKAVTKGVKASTAKLKGKKLNMAMKVKKGKKYYVKTRAVTVIKGKTYAGAWSKVMTVKR